MKILAVTSCEARACRLRDVTWCLSWHASLDDHDWPQLVVMETSSGVDGDALFLKKYGFLKDHSCVDIPVL